MCLCLRRGGGTGRIPGPESGLVGLVPSRPRIEMRGPVHDDVPVYRERGVGRFPRHGIPVSHTPCFIELPGILVHLSPFWRVTGSLRSVPVSTRFWLSRGVVLGVVFLNVVIISAHRQTMLQGLHVVRPLSPDITATQSSPSHSSPLTLAISAQASGSQALCRFPAFARVAHGAPFVSGTSREVYE